MNLRVNDKVMYRGKEYTITKCTVTYELDGLDTSVNESDVKYVEAARTGDAATLDWLCRFLEYRDTDIVSHNRKRDLVLAREAIYKYLHEVERWTLERIGLRLDRNHATVLAGINRINDLLSIQDRLAMQTYSKLPR